MRKRKTIRTTPHQSFAFILVLLLFSKMDNKITQNLVYLAQNLTNLDSILLYLLQNDIISQNEKEDIDINGTTMGKNVKLLNVIQRKDLPLETFLEILRKTNNGHCANVIDGVENHEVLHLVHPKILKNKWWPVDKILTKSLLKRKIREKLLVEELHERISKDENRMVIICESVDASKLTGMGGVGKTLTATWYAHHYENEYDHVIWIDCGEDSLLKSFESLARDLEVKNRKELSIVEEFARKCYETLEEFKCLWIFDNAESYREVGGLKEVLPKRKEKFYCLITSRSLDWGVERIGHGSISRLELNIFGETEGLEFFKENLKQEIQYTEYQLKELCRLLGNLPLALQLAVAALNTGNIDLKNYIEKTSTKDLENIVQTKFDDYEKTINSSIQISLSFIGKTANKILLIFGYIKPDNIRSKFLMKILNLQLNVLQEAIDLLETCALVSKTGTVQETPYDDGFVDKIFGRNKNQVEMDLLSIHRLLQQVIRHNGRKTEKDTLKKILGCKGFVEYKLLPFIKYADDELKKEFPKVKAELLDQQQLIRLVKERKFEESVDLAKFIDKELQKGVTKFNYSICLEMNGQLEDGIAVLEELYKQEIEEEGSYNYTVQVGLLMLESEVAKELVGGHLLVSHWKMDNEERIQEILQERKSFIIIPSQGLLDTLLRILNSNLIQSNYTLSHGGWLFTIALDGDTKRIELKECSVDLCLPFPNDLQELILWKVLFKDANGKDVNTRIDFDDLLIPNKLTRLQIFCLEAQPITVSLRSISSIEKITLSDCSLSLDSVNKISPQILRLKSISFVENGQELPNVNVNGFINFHKMIRLELVCDFNEKKNLSIDLKEQEFSNMEYIYLKRVTVVSLKSSNGRVNIKEARIEQCLLDLSILPSSLEKLRLSDSTELLVSGGIELPNLKYLELRRVSHLSHFRSLQLTTLYLREMNDINIDLFPQSAQIIRIDNKRTWTTLMTGVNTFDKLILSGFPLNVVDEIITHFNPKKQLVLCSYDSSYKPSQDLIQLIHKPYLPIAIGPFDWTWDSFKNSILSKYVDKESEYYLFHNGTGIAVEKKGFNELSAL